MFLDLIGFKITKKAYSPKKHYSGIKLNTNRPFKYRKMQLPLHRDNCILFFLFHLHTKGIPGLEFALVSDWFQFGICDGDFCDFKIIIKVLFFV